VSRSDEELAAIDQIEADIREVIRLGGDGRYVTDWVALAVSRPLDGPDDTRYSWIVPTARPPYHVLVGLVDTCLSLIKRQSTSSED
jgi:hypothetical protein